jgi:hypothetical protein
MEPKEIHPKAEAQADTPASLPTDRPTAESCAEQLPLPRALKDWLICVRKPALSLRYRMEKRHIPDLDADPSGRKDSVATPEKIPAASETVSTPTADTAEAPSAPPSADTATPGKGKNSDLMTVTGDLTIRYFDLAAGMLGLLLAGCLFRGCCWMRRQMR